MGITVPRLAKLSLQLIVAQRFKMVNSLTPTTINALTAETSPLADNDLFPIWDTSASTTDKVTALLALALDIDIVVATGSITIQRLQGITLNLGTAIALTVSNDPAAGYLIMIYRKGSGAVTHTVVLSGSAKWDGTNETANFDTDGDCLIAFAESATRFIVIYNSGVTFS